MEESTHIPVNSSEAQHILMTGMPIPRLVTKLATPAIISQMITIIYNTADTWFVAQINTSAAAAVGVVFALMSVIHAVGFSLGMGSNSLISRCLGAKRDADAAKYAASAILAGLVIGSLLCLCLLPVLKPFLRLLGATPTILPYACSYAQYILYAAPVMCMSFVLLNVLRAQGKPALAMWGLCSGGVLNLILDPLLIFHWKMGISGAAVATAVSQLISFLILIAMFASGKSIVKADLRLASHDLRDYAQVFLTGMPTVFRQGLASLATALLNVAAYPFGDAAVAAMSISYKIYLVMRGLVIGLGQGFQPVAGYNYGAGKMARVRESFRFSAIAGTVLCTTGAFLLAWFAGETIRLFLKDPEVVRIGRMAIYAMCAVMPLMAYSTYVNQLYQCLGFKKGATFLASCRQGVFFLPFVFVLPRVFGVIGLATLQPLADLLTFVISVPFQIRFFRTRLK